MTSTSRDSLSVRVMPDEKAALLADLATLRALCCPEPGDERIVSYGPPGTYHGLPRHAQRQWAHKLIESIAARVRAA